MPRTPSGSRRSPRSAPRARPILAAALLAVIALLTVGCGSSTEESATTSSTSPAQPPLTFSTGPDTTYAGTQCIARMPGQILSAEEAVVRFSPQQVCPGYVTISPGTPVTFTNDDTQPHTITVTEGNMPDGKVIASGTTEAGASWAHTFDDLGTFTYVTDAIPSFRGAVEVTTGEMAH